jgi:hypothetical protein
VSGGGPKIIDVLQACIYAYATGKSVRGGNEWKVWTYTKERGVDRLLTMSRNFEVGRDNCRGLGFQWCKWRGI